MAVFNYGKDRRKNPYQSQSIESNGFAEAARPQGSTDYLNDIAEGGQGKNFTILRGAQALDTLRGGVTDAEAGDYNNREALRQALGQQIAQYGGQSDARERNYLNTQERQLSNNVAQLRRQMGGAGVNRSSQANRSLGSVLGDSQRATAQGLNQLQLQKGQELGQLAGVNQANLQQSLMERGYTLQQAQSLAQLLQQQSMQEQNSILGSATQPGPSSLEKGLGYLFQGFGAAAGGGLFK